MGDASQGAVLKRVLMVDDDVELCESVGDYLAARTDTYKFIGFTRGFNAAIELFRDSLPDIVILDMMLGPGLDGSALVDEFRRIEKETGFKTNIFIVSKSSLYENYCVKNQLMFMQKGKNNPEALFKWIERFIDVDSDYNDQIKISVTPPKTRRDRMKDNLWSMFSSVGGHIYVGCEDCMYIIPRIIELRESESGGYDPYSQAYAERSKICKIRLDSIDSRIRNMLKTVWSKASLDALKFFYPPDLGKHMAPTPIPFIEYHVKRLQREYPQYDDKL